MRIWVDLASSPQALFFRVILPELRKRGHEVEITTRAYAQTAQLADQLGIAHVLLGRHGGRGFLQLMGQNLLRSLALARWARRRRFELALSHNSYSQAVAACLLRLPFVTLMDYEHQPLNHLSFRLARRVIVPEVFPPAMLRKYGAEGKAITYPGIKEQLYLAGLTPKPGFREQEGLPLDRPLVVVRPPAPWTAYQRRDNDLFDELLKHLAANGRLCVLFLPRLPFQAHSVRALPGIQIATRVYDGPSLVWAADAVISGGGTMNREAAVLGTPAYTVFKGRLAGVDQYLVDLGRLVRLADRSQIALLRFESGNQRLPSLCDPSLAATVANLILGAFG